MVRLPWYYAPVMELVDMRDLGSRAAMRVGSSPFRRTINQVNILQLAWFFDFLDYVRATPRNDMKKPHHLPISANCGGGSAYFRCMGKLNQAGKQRLSARIRFASANNIFNFAVCFRRPRYRVFRYRNRPFTTPKTCSTFARTDDFSCSLRFN